MFKKFLFVLVFLPITTSNALYPCPACIGRLSKSNPHVSLSEQCYESSACPGVDADEKVAVLFNELLGRLERDNEQ